MTTRIRVLPYGPSDSVNALVTAISDTIRDERINANVMGLLSENSRWRSREGDVVVNYGNRRYPESFFGSATVLNRTAALHMAANKRRAFSVMDQAGVKTVEYTDVQEIAQEWSNSGNIVYERHELTGHSGSGIIVVEPRDSVGQAELYTKGIQGPRREWRVHVFKGAITYVQKKIRRNGYREDPNYREDVRNHHTGWVYSSSFTDVPNDASLINAVKAVESMGLDFGAVDIITKGREAWVLEVNTAPGLTGTTLDTYRHNILEFVKAQNPLYTPQYKVVYQTPVEAPIEDGDGELVADSESADDENFALEGQVAQPVDSVDVVPEEMQLEGQMNTQTIRNAPTGYVLSRGYWIADIRHVHNNLQPNAMSANVILFCDGRNFYRSGWNVPVHPQQVHNPRKLESVTVEGSEVAVTL